MITRRYRVIPLATMAAALALALPAAADASASWVSNSAPVGANRSCASPGYSSIAAALAATPASGKIEVCGGTYTEQLEIVRPVTLALASGTGTAKIAMPSSPSDSQTSCDTAAGLETGQKDEISVCTAGKVAITGLDIEALAPIATCASGLYGINVGDGAELKATDDTIVGAGTTLAADQGCQHGVAVEVGSHRAAEVGHAMLKGDTISGYEKNGPTVAGTGSTMSVIDSTITGAGASPYIAQNGVQISYGAEGTVKGSTISGDECELENVCSAGALGEQATGLLFYGAAAGSGVSSSTVTGNDLGVYFASSDATQATTPEVKISKNLITANRYEGVVLEQGDASVSGDTIDGGGEFGIDIVQAGYQPYADDSSAKGDTIEGMTSAAVGVTTDGSPSDPAGNFTIANSSISHNAAEVIDPSATFTVTTSNDS